MDADEVWMVVSPQNPFKEQKGLLDEDKRLKLVELAIVGLDGLKASNVEFEMERPSYTIDTMRVLEEQYPNDEFFIIMGSDNIIHIDKWKEWEELVSRFEIAVYPRKGYEFEDSKVKSQESGMMNLKLPDTVRMIDCPIIELSSTEVRKRIREGSAFKMLISPLVSDKIKNKGYYLPSESEGE